MFLLSNPFQACRQGYLTFIGIKLQSYICHQTEVLGRRHNIGPRPSAQGQFQIGDAFIVQKELERTEVSPMGSINQINFRLILFIFIFKDHLLCATM